MGVRLVAGFLAVVVLASGATYAKGVDVSHWNGAIDWTSFVTGSYRFVFGKATEGKTLVDPTYSINRAGTESLGLRFGAYHFGLPGGSGDAGIAANAIAQADFFVDVAQPQPGELPPVLDLETKGGLTQTALQAWADAWLGEVFARTGVRGLVYASPSFWKTALGDTTSIASAGHRLWIAHWTTGAAPLVPAANWGGQGWTFWQWTNCSQVPGFLHCGDGDRYNGADPAPVAIPAYPGGAPAPGAPPTVVGTAQTGKALAGVPGVWAGGKPVTFVYQWQRCDAAGGACAPVPGATSETYVPSADDVGHALVLAVTAQAAAGSATASSPATVAVGATGGAATRPAATSAPSTTGALQAGQTLESSVGTWTGSPTSFAYQWQRCDANGAQCVAVLGATGSSYPLTAGDIGATISLVVTATGPGGSQSAPAAVTAPVAAAPVPAALPGSAVVQPGLAGAVSSPDGSATVTWQPGAVPLGATVSLAPSGRGLLLGVAPSLQQLPWPVELAYAAAPAGAVVGYSGDAQVWRPVPSLAAAVLPADKLAGTFVDASGARHVLLRAPGHFALFQPGAWGDPTLVSPGLPTPRQVAALRVRRQANGTVLIVTRVSVPSQAQLFVGVVGKTSAQRSRLLRPGAVPVRVAVSGRRLPRGSAAQLRVGATDPYGRRAALVLPFRAP